MRILQAPDSQPLHGDKLSGRPDNLDLPVGDSPLAGEPPAPNKIDTNLASDAQDTFFEARDPAELIMCIILAAAYAGMAKLCWEPLNSLNQWSSVICVEGTFVVFAILSMVLGLRPYISPSSLQVSRHGIKYRGPYWSQRKTVNWQQIFRLYLSPELIIVVYRPSDKPSGVRILFLQSSYLSDKEQIVDSFARYAMVKPFFLKNPGWYVKALLVIGYLAFVCWVLFMLKG